MHHTETLGFSEAGLVPAGHALSIPAAAAPVNALLFLCSLPGD